MLDTVEQAIEDIKQGKIVIVVDDEERENEGDFVIAARHVTPAVINFMAKEGRGLICAPIIETRADELGLELMVSSNTGLHETPFTVSIDLRGHGVQPEFRTRQGKTIRALIRCPNPNLRVCKRGHIFAEGKKRWRYSGVAGQWNLQLTCPTGSLSLWVLL
jgi:3,4-dihydroxy 2-butanone 4-phosphate synthase/GTP cyclohydrolase II